MFKSDMESMLESDDSFVHTCQKLQANFITHEPNLKLMAFTDLINDKAFWLKSHCLHPYQVN